jgi:hypothetical protein
MDVKPKTANSPTKTGRNGIGKGSDSRVSDYKKYRDNFPDSMGPKRNQDNETDTIPNRSVEG